MDNTSQPFVSVVTPVYNAEKYLGECIESVLGQTFQNWEYVIVNNCSTDRSLEIIEHCARKDNRIRVHNNDTFLNQIQNWNNSMLQISPESKYCKVIHADDWLFPECLEQMVEVAEANPTVGIVGSYRLDEMWVKCDGLHYPSTVVSGKKICRSTLRREIFVFGSPTSLLIRSDIVRQRKPFYNGLFLHADTEACYDILQNCDFGFVHQVLSYTRRHNESQTTFAKKNLTNLLEYQAMLKKYGPLLFNSREYRKILKLETKMYYIILARNILKLRDMALWNFHMNGLRKLGHKLSIPRLLTAVVLVAIDKILNPKRTVREMIISSTRQDKG